MPGMNIGDIGAKYGYNGKDNGFIKFDKVRIPRENMLMKYAKVSKKGEFTRTGDIRISYATMLITRVLLCQASFISMAKTAAISIKYSHYRKQFKS